MSWKLLKNKHHHETLDKNKLKNGKLHETAIDVDNDKKKSSSEEKYENSRVKLYPELYKSDVSINPSYTGLNCLPYYVICRRRVNKTKKQMARQFNREILHMAMMQSYAIASVRIDRNFSVGFPSKATNVRDFATNDERRKINRIMSNR